MILAEKVIKKEKNNCKIKILEFFNGKQQFNIIIALKENNICPEPLQLKVTFMPELL